MEVKILTPQDPTREHLKVDNLGAKNEVSNSKLMIFG